MCGHHSIVPVYIWFWQSIKQSSVRLSSSTLCLDPHDHVATVKAQKPWDIKFRQQSMKCSQQSCTSIVGQPDKGRRV